MPGGAWAAISSARSSAACEVKKPVCAIFQMIELRAHRLDDIGMSMAEAGNGGAAGSVEIFLALRRR